MQSITNRLKDKSHVIWDWNGTILDDIDLCVDVIGGVLREHGLCPVDRDDYRQKFRFPVRDYYSAVGFDLESLRFEDLSVKFISEYNRRVRECDLFDGVVETLEDLRRNNKKCSILSAAHQDDLVDLLSHYGIQDYFDHVFGLDNHHAACKIDRGHALVAEANIEAASTVMIGDTDHDFDVGRAIGVEVLLVGDGHQCHHRLRAVHHDVLPSRYL